MAKTAADLLNELARLGIPFSLSRHPAFFTAKDSLRHKKPGETGHGKCLMLADRRDNVVLASVLEEKRVDLKKLSHQLGLGRFSFAPPERLEGLLGVPPGAVTPYALVNLPKDVAPFAATFQVALDKDLLAHPKVYFHPLHNQATIGVAPEDLLKFLRAFGPEPKLVEA